MVAFIPSPLIVTLQSSVFCICVTVFSLLLCTICRILWLSTDVAHITKSYNDSSTTITTILSNCRTLQEKYVPTYLWGKSGHIQSFMHTIFGRFGHIHCPYVTVERYEVVATDNSVLSYDLFHANNARNSHELVVIVPGLCNHGESKYIKAVSCHLVSNGFRVVVFNHLGALESVELKRARIFTYGDTSDLDTVVRHLLQTYDVEHFIGIGFSLGGNILLKYLGENIEKQKQFSFAVSICQGYDIPAGTDYLRKGDNYGWLYDYGLTCNILNIIKQHKKSLTEYCHLEVPPIEVDWDEVFRARALKELDQSFTLKLCKQKNLDDFYQENSSSEYMERISIPLLIVNALDDPLVPEELFEYPKKLLKVNNNVLFVLTPHGGHLGFFEGGFFVPNRLSWLDRMLTEFLLVARKVIIEQADM